MLFVLYTYHTINPNLYYCNYNKDHSETQFLCFVAKQKLSGYTAYKTELSKNMMRRLDALFQVLIWKTGCDRIELKKLNAKMIDADYIIGCNSNEVFILSDGIVFMDAPI